MEETSDDSTAARGDNIGFWDRFARWYNPFMAHFSPGYEALISRLDHDLGSADDVLEVAAGTGLIANALAAKGPERRIRGLDLSPEMIIRAQEDGAGLENPPRFSTGSAYELPYPSSSMDAVICANALHVMSEPTQALGEIARVLRPGGRAFVPTYCHAQTRRACRMSRRMRLFGFRCYTRYTDESLVDQVQSAGLVVQSASLSDDAIPLCYLVATLEE